ncbi:hypothetical protein [Mangrovicoccus ximenensis]|uniref:hypothetical protein n=1 Tax=Mangrovicoccus ximenensis TaxID=1911570 RepID=UPI000D3A6B35|nr:hypothetical protein [Mangrovicoccus ximenensis]
MPEYWQEQDLKSALSKASFVATVLRGKLSCYFGDQQFEENFKVSIQSVDAQKINIRQWCYLYGRWYLPALYGLLGALVFTMRLYLNPSLPDPDFQATLIRATMGSLAGVVIGFFLAPDSTLDITGMEEFSGATGISITLLTVAFLCGFAIDVFFALFDRIVSMAQRWIAGWERPAGAAKSRDDLAA